MGTDFVKTGLHGERHSVISITTGTSIFSCRSWGARRFVENQQGNKNHWLGLELDRRKSNRDAIGAVVKVTDSSGAEQHFT